MCILPNTKNHCAQGKKGRQKRVHTVWPLCGMSEHVKQDYNDRNHINGYLSWRIEKVTVKCLTLLTFWSDLTFVKIH